MSNPEFTGYGKETWKALEKVVNRGYGEAKVFEDFLDMMIYAFDRERGSEVSRLESQYLETMRRYLDERQPGERNADFLANACAELMIETRQAQHDVLGNIFEQCITHGRNGQFFTPQNISDMMAMMMTPEGKKRIYDPACGSGRMLVSAAKLNPHAFFYATDLDARCAKMTALNLLFFNVNGLIEHGDSIRNTVHGVWLTQRTAIGGIIRWLKPDELEDYLKKRQEKFEEAASSSKATEPSKPNEATPPEQAIIGVETIPPEPEISSPQADVVQKIEELYGDLPLFQSARRDH